MEESWACLPAYLLLLLVIVASAPTFPDPEEYEDYEGVYLEDDNATGCINGLAEEDLSCLCHPCWGGVRCQSYEDNYAPRFLVHAATAVVPENITGSVYRAWATDGDLGLTCPLGGEQVTRCPCAAVTYQLFAAPGDHRFALHHTTGVLSRNLSGAALMPGQSYTYKLMVQNGEVLLALVVSRGLRVQEKRRSDYLVLAGSGRGREAKQGGRKGVWPGYKHRG
ncbi:uncharacterized protein LOC135106496 isoform X8 [Scylla paramamosain]|uniref:uncharacterized protein LOC135106496 isoform X8 n=1 Tax=Scylla paramamosain TaxID=85552 RepID=UPI003082766B